MTPQMETEQAVIIVAATMTHRRVEEVLMPSVRASSSPKESTLRRQRMAMSIAKPMSIGAMTSRKSPTVMLAKVPISQKVIWGSLSSASATSLTMEVPLWKSVETRMPPSTRPSRASLFTIRVSHTARPTASSENTKAMPWIPRLGKFSRMAMQAPRLAPAEAPSRSGLTSGFLNMPW